MKSATSNRFGLSAAMTTPFRSNGAIDHERLASHARWCLDNGCASVTAFGTTGEGASIGISERDQILGALAGKGVEGRDVVVCVAASSVDETLVQARMAAEFGSRNLLLPPPFYFKGVSDEGLFAWFVQILDKLGGAAGGVLLYNIPSVTQVALSVELIGRLKEAFPGVIAGVKDSSGDWAYTQRLLAAHKNLAILIGDERFLAQGVRLGGQGAISGLANICRRLFCLWRGMGRARADRRLGGRGAQIPSDPSRKGPRRPSQRRPRLAPRARALGGDRRG